MRLASVVLAGLVCGVAACTGSDEEAIPEAEYIAVRRAWRPGERDSVVASVIANRGYDIPGIGDMSDYIDLMLNADSTEDMVLNPDYLAPSLMGPGGPSFSVNAVHVPGAGWTSTGLDVKLVNNNPGQPEVDWLGVFWSNNTTPTRKGILLAGAAGLTFPTTTVNTTTFDATGVGVGSAELNTTTAPFTYYENRGEGGTYRVIATTFAGGASTLTSGPFTGGTLRTGTQNEVITNVIMTRRSGTGTPTSVTASLSGTITAWEMTCIFPTPCTTNVPGLAAAALRGPLPDSLYEKLPWIASLPEHERGLRLQRRRR